MAVFGVWDYVIFSLTIILSLAVGMGLSLRGQRVNTVIEYLVGGRKLQLLPVTVSLVATMFSAIDLVGNPVEVYLYGMGYIMYVIAVIIGAAMATATFLPLYYTLGYKSVMEYIRDRYDSRYLEIIITVTGMTCSLIACSLFLMTTCITLPAVSAVPTWGSVLIAGVTSTVFTALGGMKAVVWTDVFQAVVSVAGLLTVLIMGTQQVGGVARVIEVNRQWGRLDFHNFNPSPADRRSVWSIVFAQTFMWMFALCSQAMVQRYNSLPTLRHARWAVAAAVPGVALLGALSCSTGAVAFAYYAQRGCDPVMEGLLASHNQILPYFVTDVIDVPGVPGLFIASIFAASLSTVSSHLSGLGAMTWENLLKHHPYMASLPPAKQTNIIKVTVICYGALTTAGTFLFLGIPGSLLQITHGVMSSVFGPMAAIFTVGALYRHLSAKGAVLTFGLCLPVVLWMSLGSVFSGIFQPPQPLPATNCTAGGGPDNSTAGGDSKHTDRSGLQQFYSVGFMWYMLITMIIASMVGAITTFIPGLRKEKPAADKLLFTFCRKSSRREQPEFMSVPVMDPIDQSALGNDADIKTVSNNIITTN